MDRGSVIGISAALERVRWGPWDQEVTMAPRSYAAAVQAAGCSAILLPPGEAPAADPEPLLDRIDALLLSGGSDIDPASYGAAAHPETSGTSLARDSFELALARGALEREMPLLGICRGMQLLNIALGGTLNQHLPDVVGDERHRHTPGAFGDHEVRLEPGTLAARAVGSESLSVLSHHHQGVDELGRGLVASGWSVEDGVVEALELPDHAFALGVLWHPEEGGGREIAALAEAARPGVGAR